MGLCADLSDSHGISRLCRSLPSPLASPFSSARGTRAAAAVGRAVHQCPLGSQREWGRLAQSSCFSAETPTKQGMSLTMLKL